MQANNELSNLWCQRDSLDESGWGRLYVLICCTLKQSKPSILRSLPESKEHYIQEFFLFKVFEPTKHNSNAPIGPNELCTYFNNFLIDVYRSAQLRNIDFIENYDEVEHDCRDVLSDEGTFEDKEFYEHGKSYQDVYVSALAFLKTLDEVARIYLALHACADKPEPISSLAKRFCIPSYHYRARQLGISRKKGEFAAGYEFTLIGNWLAVDLGLELSSGAAVLAALKILCLASLSQYQPSRSQDE